MIKVFTFAGRCIPTICGYGFFGLQDLAKAFGEGAGGFPIGLAADNVTREIEQYIRQIPAIVFAHLFYALHPNDRRYTKGSGSRNKIINTAK